MPKPKAPLYRGRFRRINVRIWRDQKFCRLDDHAKLLFLRLLTDPDLTTFGALAIAYGGLADSLGWEKEQVSECISQLSEHGLAHGCEKAGLIVLWNYVRYNPPANPKQIQGWEIIAEELPECGLLSRYLAQVSNIVRQQNPLRENTVPIPFLNHHDTYSDTDIETDTDTYTDTTENETGSDTGSETGTGTRERYRERDREREQPPFVGCRAEQPTGSSARFPVADLVQLKLYRDDSALCERWEELKAEWTTSCPDVDVMAEVRKAHAWEVDNPKRRKKDRARFLGGWIRGVQANRERRKRKHKLSSDVSEIINRPSQEGNEAETWTE